MEISTHIGNYAVEHGFNQYYIKENKKLVLCTLIWLFVLYTLIWILLKDEIIKKKPLFNMGPSMGDNQSGW